jgi:hypothetical protein
MNTNIDLNIENYDLNDLLNLFSLDEDFNEEDLKRCKKEVLKTHPDKSNLPKEYFIFFGKAYKYIYNIYEFKRKIINENKITDYNHYVDNNEYDNIISEKINKKKDFNKWFNKMFEQYRIKEDSDNGHEEWLKSNENMEEINIKSGLNNNFEKYKNEKIKTLIVHSSINECCNGLSCGNSELVSTTNNYRNGDIFSKNLNYDDVKVAHSETFIPVTIDDYNNKKKYNSIFELNNERTSQNITPMNNRDANEYFRRKSLNDNTLSNNNAYYLLKKEEQAKKNNLEFMKKLQLLK